MVTRSISVYKRFGETPLQCLNRLRASDIRYADAVLGYAGRLDPMAEGVLLVLVGDENKKRATYLSLTKEYLVDILFGFATDTYDILGLVIASENEFSLEEISAKVADYAASVIGVHEQEYPPYSSKTVAGKPLHAWAREGSIGTIVLPKKRIEIFSCDVLGSKMFSKEMLSERIAYSLASVSGDFRQEQISLRWKEILEASSCALFPVVQLKVACSSGTYVRGIANNLGRKLGTHALALRIVRVKVGDRGVDDVVLR